MTPDFGPTRVDWNNPDVEYLMKNFKMAMTNWNDEIVALTRSNEELRIRDMIRNKQDGGCRTAAALGEQTNRHKPRSLAEDSSADAGSCPIDSMRNPT